MALIVPVSALAQDPDSHEGEAALESADAEPATSEGESPAAPDATERARAAFARGIACVEEHETACAERAFREALALHDAPAVRYNLASALFELGRYPEAARLTASVIADSTTPAPVLGHAEALRDQLSAQGATLSIALEGASDGVEVQVDGEAIPASQHAEVIVAPGSRVVTAHREGAEVARREVAVEAGAREEVALVVAPAAADVAAVPEQEAAPSGTPLHEEPTFWAIVGGGAALVVTVIVIIAVVAATAGVEGPIEGNYEPGVLRW